MNDFTYGELITNQGCCPICGIRIMIPDNNPNGNYMVADGINDVINNGSNIEYANTNIKEGGKKFKNILKFITVLSLSVILLIVIGGINTGGKQCKSSDIEYEQTTNIKNTDENNENMTYDRIISLKFQVNYDENYDLDCHITSIESNYPTPLYDEMWGFFSGPAVVPYDEVWTFSYATYQKTKNGIIVYSEKSTTPLIWKLNPATLKYERDLTQRRFFSGDKFMIGHYCIQPNIDSEITIEIEAHFTSNKLQREKTNKMYSSKVNQVKYVFTDEQSVFDYLTKDHYEDLNSFDFYRETSSSTLRMWIKNDKCIYYRANCVLKSLTLIDFNETEALLTAKTISNRAWLYEKPNSYTAFKPVPSNVEDSTISVYVNRRKRTIIIGDKMYFKRDSYDR